MNHEVDRRSFCTALLSGLATAGTALAQSDAPLEIGVLPNISARVLLAQYQPMRDYLARVLKRPVQVSTAPNWVAFHQRTLALEYDLAITAANLARVAQLDGGLRPLLSYMPKIKGMLIHARARPIASVTALRGQTLALSNPKSLVTLRGMQWLAEQGLQRDRDFKTTGTPTDDSVGNVVVRGDAIAAMLSGGEYRAIPDAIRAQVDILVTFAEVSSFVVVASPKLASAELGILREQLLAFSGGSDEGKAFFASTGFTGIREVEPGLMESLDPYVDSTRRSMSETG